MATESIGAPQECDFERRRGDTKDIAVRLTQNGTAIPDATGYSGLLTINRIKDPNLNVSPVTGEQIFQAVGSPNSPATDAILRFDFSLFNGGGSPEQQAVEPGNYFYDIQITDPDGEVDTRQVGKFKVVQDITKN